MHKIHLTLFGVMNIVLIDDYNYSTIAQKNTIDKCKNQSSICNDYLDCGNYN